MRLRTPGAKGCGEVGARPLLLGRLYSLGGTKVHKHETSVIIPDDDKG